jgi:hypothetical protein
MPAQQISTKRIGYLRSAPASVSDPASPPKASVASMWRKLADEGVVEETSKGLFRRTPAGDAALEEYDAGLSEAVRIVLNAVKAKVSGAPAMKGMKTAISAGLVRYLEDAPYYVFKYALTPDGERLADPIGEEGYFRKSGNLVLVLGLCTDKGCEGMLEVERLYGDSKGKRMLIPRDGFVTKAAWETMTA